MFEHCGVIGIYSFEGENVVPMIMAGLEALQHRGQESRGITIPEGPPYKRLGSISQMEYDKVKAISKIVKNVAVGHVRYTTSSKSIIKNAHPLEIGQSKKFYICHNGTLDRGLIISWLKRSGVSHDPSVTDTELLGRGIHHSLRKGKS